MKDTITELLQSKKFLAFAVSALLIVMSPLVSWFGYEIDPEKLALLVGTAATYILSQGISDNGKAAAQLHLDAANVMASQPMVVETKS